MITLSPNIDPSFRLIEPPLFVIITSYATISLDVEIPLLPEF